MMICCICGNKISADNCSEEHIIHNAIGGVLKDTGIYCKTCNSKFGSDTDIEFTKIFSAIIDNLDMNFDRKTQKTSYEGVMCDEKGTIFKTRFKNRKVVSMFDDSGKYKQWESGKYRTIYYNFNLDNHAFKRGLAKIAFNYAIHCGVASSDLNKLFDDKKQTIVSSPYIIPFMPLNLFDARMEVQLDSELYHALRIFNCNNCLYVYIELFSTFQFYVLLSEKYQGDVDKCYSQTIRKNDVEKKTNTLLKSLEINDYKDVYIVASQYNIDIDTVIKDLKEYHDYKGKNISIVFEKIQKIAYEKIRKQAYEKKYSSIINTKYHTVDFLELLERINVKDKMKLYEAFTYYTIYEEDNVDLKKYKRLISIRNVNISYPELISGFMFKNQLPFRIYGYMKFYNLMQHLKVTRCDNQ